VSFFGSGPLTCGVNAYPWLGGSFTVSTHFVGAGTPLIPHLIAGFSNTTSPLGPLPLGLGAMFDNATLRVDPVILLAMVPASPTTHATTLSLPAVPGLAGMHLYLQVIAYLPTSPPAWGTSAGIDCTLGWL
jgi:hypothetical protein